MVWLCLSALYCVPGHLAANAVDQSRFELHGHRLTPSVFPVGVVTVGGVQFEVRKQPLVVTADSPERTLVAEWPKGRRASELAVLHTLHPGPAIENWRLATGLAHRLLREPPDWPAVCVLEIEYVDGTKAAIPVRYGESIREWYRVQTVGPMLWARNAWTRPLSKLNDTWIAAYAFRVPNPQPELPVRRLTVSSTRQSYQDHGTLFILAAELVPAAPASGRVVFLAPRPIGRDGGNGSFRKPLADLQRALDQAAPGDTLYLRGGRYPLTLPLTRVYNGETSRWLTISAYPGETPIIDAAALRFDVEQRPYSPKGSQPLGAMQHDTGALHIWGDPHCLRIQGLHIRNSRRAGISVYGTRAPAPQRDGWAELPASTGVEILFNTTLRTFSMGIISHQTDRLRIIGNRVIRPHALELGDDPFTEEPSTFVNLAQEAIDLSRNVDFEVAFNVVSGGSKEAIDLISVERGTVHHNYVESCLNGIYLDGWTVPIREVRVHRNFIRNAYNGIPLATEGGSPLLGIDISHNIVLETKSSAITISEATYKAEPTRVQGNRARFNTVHRAGHHALAIDWEPCGMDIHGFPANPGFRDNIVSDNIVVEAVPFAFRNSYKADAAERDIRIERNLVWPAFELADHKDADPGIKTLVADPLLVDPSRGDVRLRAGSPAIGAGAEGRDLGALPYGSAWIPGLDFAGNVTMFYHGHVRWEPLEIPPDRFTLHRNNLQRPSWFQFHRYGPDFRQLADGDHALAGVIWRIAPDGRPSLLVLAGNGSESTAESIEGLPVGRKADRLAFLHAAHLFTSSRQQERTKPGTELFKYRVHYADGQQLDIPVRVGQEVDHWILFGPTPPSNLPAARLAWYMPMERRRTDRPMSGGTLQLFSMEWKNPRPEIVISSIDIVRTVDQHLASPAVFAISLGQNNTAN